MVVLYLVLLVVVALQYYSTNTVKNLHSNESKSDISAHEFYIPGIPYKK